MNRSIIAAMITLDLRGFEFSNEKLHRELLQPGQTPDASVAYLGSMYCTPPQQESQLRQEAKGMHKRLQTMSDEQVQTAFPAVVGRFLGELKLLQMRGRIHAEA